MELKGSLPHSQMTATCPYPDHKCLPPVPMVILLLLEGCHAIR